jgi:hypothetical protein
VAYLSQLGGKDIMVEPFLATAKIYYSISTDAPHVYGEATALAVLGHALGRSVVHSIQPDFVYHNVYCLLVGESTYARKTTAQRLGKKYYDSSRWLPNEFSPESFLQILSKQPEGIVWLGEFSKLMKGIKGHGYMATFAECLNDMFDCPDKYERKLTDKKGEESLFTITNAYPSMHSTITPKVLHQQIDSEMFDGGLMARWLVIHGEAHPKPRGRLPLHVSDYSQMLRQVINRVMELDKSDTVFMMSDEALKYYNDVVEKTFQNDRFKGTRAFCGRYEGYVVSLSDLYWLSEAIGNAYDDFCLGQISKLVELNKYIKLEETISDKAKYVTNSTNLLITQKRHVQQAFEFVLPCLEYVQELSNYVDMDRPTAKLRDYLKKREGVVEYSDAMRMTNLNASQMKEAITTLQERSEILYTPIRKFDKNHKEYGVRAYTWK